MSVSAILQTNLAAVFDEIRVACERSNRNPQSVRLVAVTKYAAWDWVSELSRLHQTFGENRPQQLAERQSQLPQIEWHLIGQLQRNKVKQALLHATLIHSVDSMRLLEEIAKVAHSLSVKPKILLQVNVSGEASKSGFSIEDLQSSWPQIISYHSQVAIEGLMTMAPDTDDVGFVKHVFSSLGSVRDELASREDSKEPAVTLPELSMGMSGDFVPAIEAGATLVRIGSRIFQGL